MATHYKGQRIEELLAEVARMEGILKHAPDEIMDSHTAEEFARGFAVLALAKAKLTSLKEDK